MRLRFGAPGDIDSIADAVSRYGAKEFESPTRSTIPMLSLLIHDMAKFEAIASDLGMPDGGELFLEYTVRPPKGRGKASHTDVMLKAAPDALAIEAKWTEPMYGTVKKWRGHSDNRRLVLQGWLDLLQARVAKELLVQEFDDAIYQMVHRAASVAKVGEKPRLAYFLFEPSLDSRSAKPKAIKKKLSELWAKLGSPGNFPFYVVRIEMQESDAQKELRKRKKGGKTSELVSAFLQSDTPLFSFDNYSVERIGE